MQLRLIKPLKTIFGSLPPGAVIELPDDNAVGRWMAEHSDWAELVGAKPVAEPEPVVEYATLEGGDNERDDEPAGPGRITRRKRGNDAPEDAGTPEAA